MVTIVLYGDRQDQVLLHIFERNLKPSFSVHTVTAGSIRTAGNGPDILIVNSGNPHTVKGKNCIVVLKPDADMGRIRDFSRDVVVLANSACPEQLRQLSEMKLRTIVCGISSKDTITYSSLNENDAAVSLQRTIETLQGRSVEPMEITVDFTAKYDPSTVLLYVASLLVSGVDLKRQEGENRISFQ